MRKKAKIAAPPLTTKLPKRRNNLKQVELPVDSKPETRTEITIPTDDKRIKPCLTISKSITQAKNALLRKLKQGYFKTKDYDLTQHNTLAVNKIIASLQNLDILDLTQRSLFQIP